MKKKIAWILCLLFFSSFLTVAQILKPQTIKNQKYEGRIIATELPEGLFGATVVIKGTTNGVAADQKGNFVISANEGDMMVISSIGYQTREIRLDKLLKLASIVLKSDVVALKEIAIVGYGTQERRDLTGAVASIKPAEMDRTSLSFDNALAGTVAGVQISQSSGVPGGATAITIRGITSLNGSSNNPLIVIDGVPIYGNDRSQNTTSFDRTSIPMSSVGGSSVSNSLPFNSDFERNQLSMLNPDDIESIEILKDAYATAIYGSRGAAGVILVTTKHGFKGAPKVELSTITSYSQPIGKPTLMNGAQYSEFYTSFVGGKYSGGTEKSWLNDVLRTGVSREVNASVSAGTDKMTYYLSLSSVDQQSYIINQDYSKYNAHINVSYKSSEKLSFGSQFSLNYSDNTSLNAQSIFQNAILKAPNIPVYDQTGAYYFGFAPNSLGRTDNPIAQARADINYIIDVRNLGNIFIEYRPINWITLRSEAGIDFLNSEGYSRLVSRPDLVGGDATQTTIQNRKFVVNNTATLLRKYNRHLFNGVVGQSFETSRELNDMITGRGFPSDNILSISQAQISRVSSSLVQQWALFSVFGRLNYRFEDKYLLGATYRLDGSSRFNKNHRYIGFPSFSAGWRISGEPFMERYLWIKDLKIRGSIGFSGIDGTGGYYGNQGQYSLSPNGIQYNGMNLLQVVQPNNPNLKWEKTRSIDVGIDADLFDSKLKFTLDYYYKVTNDMLYSSAIPLYMGFGSQQQNIGDMRNTGLEFAINAIVLSGNLKWKTSFNIAGNRNKILKLNFAGSEVTGPELGYKYFAVGKSAGQFYLFHWEGIDPLTGNPQWRLSDGRVMTIPPEAPQSNIVNPDQYRIPMGTALPDYFGGWSNNFSYKRFDLNILLTYSVGNKMMNVSKSLMMTYTTSDRNNLTTEELNYWLIPGQVTNIPKPKNQSIIGNSYGGSVDYSTSLISDRFLEDASFLRLKKINLSYNLPAIWAHRLKMDKLAVFVQANNLFTLTKYTGIDPEVNSFGSSILLSGYDQLTLPQAKTISAGLNIRF